MEFAVRLSDEAPDKGYWVLFVDADRERLLIGGENGSLRWVNTADCFVVRAVTPDDQKASALARPVVLGRDRALRL